MPRRLGLLARPDRVGDRLQRALVGLPGLGELALDDGQPLPGLLRALACRVDRGLRGERPRSAASSASSRSSADGASPSSSPSPLGPESSRPERRAACT